MQLIEVPVTDDLVKSGKGRISYPLLKEFLGSGMGAAKVDLEDIETNVGNVYVTLSLYIKTHSLPVRVSMRKQELYLARTDLDEKDKATKIVLDDIMAKRKPR